MIGNRCPGCGVWPDEIYLAHCEVERCPDCGGQRISCEEHTSPVYPRIPWSGEWPGKAECRDFEFYAYWGKDHGWTKCSVAHPGAVEDLNRLYIEAVWDAEQERFILPSRFDSEDDDEDDIWD